MTQEDLLNECKKNYDAYCITLKNAKNANSKDILHDLYDREMLIYKYLLARYFNYDYIIPELKEQEQ